MIASSIVCCILLLYVGQISEDCRNSCGFLGQRYSYALVIIIWLLVAFVYCLFWGAQVSSVVSHAQSIVMPTAATHHQSTILECFLITWRPFAAVMRLPSVSRQILPPPPYSQPTRSDYHHEEIL